MRLLTRGCGLFTNPPKKQLKERYGFEPSKAWLKNLQQSAVRFNSGGSGAFVSPEGLVITNHHVGADALQKLSTPDRDLVAKGFHAKTRDEEIKCVDLELNVLMNTEDVTSRVNAAVKPDMSQADAEKAGWARMNTIEGIAGRHQVARCDHAVQRRPVPFCIQVPDVRLVFAPGRISFGGDLFDICTEWQAGEEGWSTAPWSKEGPAKGSWCLWWEPWSRDHWIRCHLDS
jgi:hypothetical protein